MAQSTKRDLVRECVKRAAEEAILLHSARMADRVVAESIRARFSQLATDIAWHLCEEYRFLELSDIFEWKRERIRR